MESFFSRYKNALVLLLVLVLQLLALAVQAKRPAPDAGDPEAVSLIRYVVVTVITPPEKLLHNTGLWFRNLWFGYIDLVHTRRDNNELKDELERLRLEQASVVEDAKQGQRLERLLGFKEHYIYQTVPSQVIGTSGTDQSGIVYLDKGSNDGLKQDMPVMTADGIVGRLKDVFPSTSQLMLISDATSGVGVMLESTRTRGVLKGSTYGQIQMINVSPDDRIKPGEKIITSGGDQIFPRGMPVGEVDHVEPDPDRDPLLDVVVRPAANLSRLEEVLVITGMGDAASPLEARDLAASEAESEAAQKRASDILSERLPSRIDPNAPADTNPDQNVDSTGNVVRPLAPPKPLHADGFTPGATPPASELTPGARIMPVKNGVEELSAAKAQAAKKAEAPADGAASGVATGGTTTPRKPAEVDENGVVRSTAPSRTGAGAEAVPGASSGAATVGRPVRPAGETTAHQGETTAHQSEVPGESPAPIRRPAPAVNSSAARGASAGGEAAAPLKPETTTHVIVDGPENRVPRSYASPNASAGAKPKPEVPNAGAPKPVTPVRKSPMLVPDDGSRPPSAVRPKKPAAPTPQPAAPQGRGA
jgi:rod shape-determining protein MreC